MLIARELRRAPEGYEDDYGFHTVPQEYGRVDCPCLDDKPGLEERIDATPNRPRELEGWNRWPGQLIRQATVAPCQATQGRAEQNITVGAAVRNHLAHRVGQRACSRRGRSVVQLVQKQESWIFRRFAQSRFRWKRKREQNKIADQRYLA